MSPLDGSVFRRVRAARRSPRGACFGRVRLVAGGSPVGPRLNCGAMPVLDADTVAWVPRSRAGRGTTLASTSTRGLIASAPSGWPVAGSLFDEEDDVDPTPG